MKTLKQIAAIQKDRDYRKKFPWMIMYQNAKTRCRNHPTYIKRNIKVLMTPEDFKFLWLRDKAHELTNPSIDRIDTFGNYELSNCRVIELKENQRRINTQRSGWEKHRTCKVCNEDSRRHYAFGLCSRCYQNRNYKSKMNALREAGLKKKPGGFNGRPTVKIKKECEHCFKEIWAFPCNIKIGKSRFCSKRCAALASGLGKRTHTLSKAVLDNGKD